MSRIASTLLLVLLLGTSAPSLDDLRASVSTGPSLNIDDLTRANFIEKRRSIVQWWTPRLKAIEDAHDPTVDPNERFWCPPPPPLGGLIRINCYLPSWLEATNKPEDPSKIAEYNRNIARIDRYYALTRIDEEAMSAIESTLTFLTKLAPDGTSADYDSLDAILQQGGISNARRKTLDKLFRNRAYPLVLAGQAMQKYKASHTIGDLHTAVDAMQNSMDQNELIIEPVIDKRRAVLSVWAPILNAIERLSYPAARDIDAQSQAMVCATLRRFHRMSPDGTPSDFAALDAILRRSGMSEARRRDLDALLIQFGA